MPNREETPLSFDPSIADTDPTAGEEAGSQQEGTQPAAPAAPAGRFTDQDMANARRSFEAQAAQRQAAAIAQAQAEWQRSQAPKADPNDPWAFLDPTIAAPFKKLFDSELETRMAPFKQQQEDLAFRNDEAAIAAKFKDYSPNRAAILQFAVQNGIANLNAAYHAWRSETQWQDPEVIGKKYLADYQKRKATQSSETPLAEGRGGGSPSTKTNFRGKDGKLDKDAMDAHALEIISASRE